MRSIKQQIQEAGMTGRVVEREVEAVAPIPVNWPTAPIPALVELAEPLNAEAAAFINQQATAALAEDVGGGDWTSQLISPHQINEAQLLCRDSAVLCGRWWFEAVMRQLDPGMHFKWSVAEGGAMSPGGAVCWLRGNARALLTGERTALNFLQTLSGVATATRRCREAIGDSPTWIMDTRKTLPGLRLAQKYAVRVGGGHNQRIGLFDGILIKENHIAAAGGIAAVLRAANHLNAGVPIQIEVETLEQLEEALNHEAQLILLDNFSLAQMREAVALNAGRAALEASGGLDLAQLREVAQTGVQRISIGAITKHVLACDFSLRLTMPA